MLGWPTQIPHGLAVFDRIAASSQILQGLPESMRGLFVTFLLGRTSEVFQIGSQYGGGDIHLQLRALPFFLTTSPLIFTKVRAEAVVFPASKGVTVVWRGLT